VYPPNVKVMPDAALMIVTKETVTLEGVLKGEGRERQCRVRVTRRETYADECMRPLCVSYSRCEIDDNDDFPDGEYDVNFDGCQILLTKRGGQYLRRSSEAPSPCAAHAEIA
jgi:hypothetical protein